MTVQIAQKPLHPIKNVDPTHHPWVQWLANLQINFELWLAAITLLALLIGWIGGSVTHVLPAGGVLLMALIAYAAGGYAGLTGAIAEARQGKLDIDFLMIAAALGAALIGEWKDGALLLFLFTLSGALEEYAMDRTRRAIEALAELRPSVARVRRDEREIELAVDDLTLGDIVLVRPGERLPVDGVITQGGSSLDQSSITGESTPVYKSVNEGVYAGSINGSGALEVRMDRPASESTLSRIIQMVQDARQDTAPTQQWIDRFSQPYTYAVLTATLLTILIPYLFGNEPFHDTLYRAMTLLVVASPCALIISTPASVLSAIAALARHGVLLKGGAYLEKLANLSTIAFDKTGTLTRGKPAVTDILPCQKYTSDELLRVAASAELSSEHPLARAVVDAAKAQNLTLVAPDELEAIAGHGIQASYADAIVWVGKEKLFAEMKIELPAPVIASGEALRKAGKTAMLVGRSPKTSPLTRSAELTSKPHPSIEFLGWIAVADTLRAETHAAVEALHKIGIEQTIMLTGDHKVVAQAVAQAAGVDTVHSDLLPEDKVRIIKELVAATRAQRPPAPPATRHPPLAPPTSHLVAMIGDGVNDAPALAAADIGIAIGAGGTDVALETADVVLMSGDLMRLPFAIQLSRQAERIVRQNVIFAVSVMLGLVVITLFAPLLFPGFRLPLPLGVVGHEGSTLIVVANGLRLLMAKPPVHSG